MRGKALIGLLTVVQICCFAWEVNSAEFCVGTAGELENALSLAVANGESDTVKIQRGTYVGYFQFVSDEDTDIAVLGGYGPACTERVIDPTNTVLDADGSRSVLSFTKYNDGDLAVEGLTLRNGSYRGLYIRLYNESGGNVGSIDINRNIITNNQPKGGIYIGSSCSPPFTAGSVRLTGNVITGNISDYGGGGLSMQLPWGDFSNDVVLVNNVVAGNIGSSVSGGVFINPGSETSVYLVNNSIVDNQAIGASSDVGGAYIGSFSNCALYIYNNIIRGNTAETGVADIWFFNYGSTRIGFNNSYSDIHGTWTDAADNGDVDPQFVLSGHWDDSGTPGDPVDDVWVDGNYHLGETSACIDAGHAIAPELPSTDFEGDPRAVDGDNDGAAAPDIGADEVALPCSADVEPDGDVDAADLIVFVVAYGSSKGEVNYNSDVDFNVDGSVDDTDLAMLADEFGRTNCS